MQEHWGAVDPPGEVSPSPAEEHDDGVGVERLNLRHEVVLSIRQPERTVAALTFGRVVETDADHRCVVIAYRVGNPYGGKGKLRHGSPDPVSVLHAQRIPSAGLQVFCCLGHSRTVI